MKKKISRRSFMKSAAAAIALPAIIPASALSQAGRTAPSDRIVLGFIGIGNQGTNQLVGIRWAPQGGFAGRDDTHIVACCDVNKERLATAVGRVNERYGNTDCASYHNYEDLLAREDIDAVVIATGDRWHANLSIAAMKAGKDLYCEKPHTLTIREAQAVAETMRRYNRIMQVGTQQRSWHEFRYTCELVRNGYIGELKSVIVNVGGPPRAYCDAPGEPAPDYIDWDRWLGPCPWRPFSSKIFPNGWGGYRDYSGGEMTNWGAHMFDIAQWGLGMDESGPVEIIPPDGTEFKVLTYRYDSGAILTREPISKDTQGVRFTGTDGWIEVSRDHLISSPESLIYQPIGPNEIHLHKAFNHQTDFLDSVRTRRRNASDAEVGKRSITVCHLGNIAYFLERPLAWDPKKEEFANDPAANRMLERDQRSPWCL